MPNRRYSESYALEKMESRLNDISDDEYFTNHQPIHHKDNSADERVKLELVLGLTVSSNAALDYNSWTKCMIFPAGSTIIFLNPLHDRQEHLINVSRKPITCLSYSKDGRYIVTGEYGHLPNVRIWDLQRNSQLYELVGHKHGIDCVVFSPDQKYVVSIGSQHDMIVNVWDWELRVKIASNKVSAKIKAVSFSETGDYFVTVGNRHIRFWYFRKTSRQTLHKSLVGRSAILGEQGKNDFVDVACGKGKFTEITYVITRSGILCEFNNRRLLERWVDIKTSCANCIVAGKELIFIGCADSIVRCFNAKTLEFVTTLPRTHYLGVNVSEARNIRHATVHPENAIYPDTIALTLNDGSDKVQNLMAVYNDHSIYVWDITNIKKVGKLQSYMYHSACIWDIQVYPNTKSKDLMPNGSFVTCSSDDTIRVWHSGNWITPCNTQYCNDWYNIYSTDLVKAIYTEPHLRHLKDVDIGLPEKTEHLAYNESNGIRAIRITPDGLQLASGDRCGNIRIYDLKSLKEVCKINAHDAEILCLEYNPPTTITQKLFLVSASKDRLIHVFDATDGYKFVETLDDHTSSVTAVRFIEINNQLYLVSCSADKTIVFRTYHQLPSPHFLKERTISSKCMLYDIAVDCSQKYVLIACQDRNIRVYNVNSGKYVKSFKGSSGQDGCVIKIAFDRSGRYLATSCTDKTLCIYDYYSEKCMACLCGHSELVTGLWFSNDCEHLISASGDGCIFIWHLPHDMVVTMQARLSEQQSRISSSKPPIPFEEFNDPLSKGIKISSFNKDHSHTQAKLTDNMKFNDEQLPRWVTKSPSEELPMLIDNAPRIMMPKGRWAQRMEYSLSSESILQLPVTKTDRESDGSKEESSVDSGTETSRPEDHHEKLIVPEKTIRPPPKFITITEDFSEGTEILGKKMNRENINEVQEIRARQHTDDSSLGSFKNEDIESAEHDGDVEDYSEIESAENDPKPDVTWYRPSLLNDTLSEFKVNAMDIEELRRSQRRIKQRNVSKKLLSVNTTASSYSVSGSQESEDEDEIRSTPSAGSSEKNHLSLHSSSNENINIFSQRERFLKSTYESLSGIDTETPYCLTVEEKKHTISSKHISVANHGTEIRNERVIQATRQNHDNAQRARQVLKSRIDDIREQLQYAGQRNDLKKSESSYDIYQLANEFVKRKCKDDDGALGRMRKSLSLDELRETIPPVIKKSGLEYSRTSGKTSSHEAAVVSRKKSFADTKKEQSSSQRHMSMKPQDHNQRIMRPTISSQNKVKNNSALSVSNSASRRRNLAISCSAINEIGSSSSDECKRDSISHYDKSNSRSSRKLARSFSEKDLFKVPMYRKSNEMKKSSSEMQNSSGNPHLTKELSMVLEGLQKNTKDLVSLYREIKRKSVNENDKLLLDLRSGINKVQNELRKMDDTKNKEDISASCDSDTSLVSMQSNNWSAVLNQISDALVSIVEKKIENKT